MSPTFQPTPQQQEMLSRLAGLPYVTLAHPDASSQRFVGQLRNGDKVRACQVEDIWQAALIVEALEGPGSASRSAGDSPSGRLHAELLAMAERLYGCTVTEGLAIYLGMQRSVYGRWEDRPRMKWPRPSVN